MTGALEREPCEAPPDARSGLQAPPAFLERPKEEYFQEVGRELLIPCSAQGDPPPAISWAKVRFPILFCLHLRPPGPCLSLTLVVPVGRRGPCESGWGGNWSCPW